MDNTYSSFAMNFLFYQKKGNKYKNKENQQQKWQKNTTNGWEHSEMWFNETDFKQHTLSNQIQ